MIKGVKHWDNRSRYYSQTNNSTESILRKVGVKEWLETCGSTAAVNCLAAMGHDVTVFCPGQYRPQPEDVLTNYFNDPRNYKKFEKIRKNLDPNKYPGNRVPQYYPLAAREVFNVEAEFKFLKDFESVAEIISSGFAVQLCLVSPGHYIAAVAYDEDTEEIIFNDPWPDRFPDGNGFNQRLDREKYEKNVEPYVIIYRRQMS